MTDDLALIYIRARIDGHWGSFSIRELLNRGHAGEIGRWFLETILQKVGVAELDIITEASAQRMVAYIEKNVRGLVRVKP